MATINDIVLIYFEDDPLVFARIEDISPDVKPDWYHLKLLLLQNPLKVVTWILRDVYINGETFTMNAKNMRLEKVVCPQEPREPDEQEDGKQATLKKSGNTAKVISLADIKKKGSSSD